MTTPPGTTSRATKANGEDDPLVRALNHVADSVGELVVESRKRDRRVLLLLGVIAVLVIALGGMGLSNRKVNDSNREILQAVRDCTAEEAPGDCYERTQQRTAAYLAELAATEFDIAWCVKVADSKAEAERCVTAARQGRQARPGR
jgi:cobalamin biosynthesis protein CbiD